MKKENVLITEKKNDFDKWLAEIFIREGYNTIIADKNVPAGKIDFIDIYVDVSDERNNADKFSIRDGLDEDVLRSVYEVNVLESMKMLETYLPLLDKGSGKRLCFLTATEASINETREINGFAYKMSKAAMHNFFQMISNKLSPAGYTFRVYDPMYADIDAKASAEGAFNYFTRRRGIEQNNPLRDDETRLVFRDALGREHTW